MNKKSRIFVAGHKGLIGSAVLRCLQTKGYHSLLTMDRLSLDLTKQSAVCRFFEKEQPDIVMLAAAKVGGILANQRFRADFIFQNLQIQHNVIFSAVESGVSQVIALGSSCIYPRGFLQPMTEQMLLTGPLEYTNRPYAIAKIAGLESIHAIRKQYQKHYFSVMPTNSYGPGDNFHPEHSHVIPGLMQRFIKAKRQRLPEITIWGSGRPLREFIFVDDCADAIVHLAEQLTWDTFEKSSIARDGFSHINIGTGVEISIRELATMVAAVCGFEGNLVFDTRFPDGTPRKRLNSSFLRSLGWQPKTDLLSGLTKTLAWLKLNPHVIGIDKFE